MTTREHARARAGSGALDAALEQVRAQAASWFPQRVTGPVAPRLAAARERPRCSVYRVDIADGGGGGRVVGSVVVKVRVPGAPAPGGHRRGVARPTLAAAAPPGTDLSALEYAGLDLIARSVGGQDRRFGVVRPLAHLPEHSTIIMDHVAAPTLRSVLLRGSRLHPRRARLPDEPWSTTGAWLRAFHQVQPQHPVDRRMDTRDGVLDRFAQYESWLGMRLADRAAVADVCRAAVRVAAEALPDALPVALGHGDFAARNVFVDTDHADRVTVFDPMPRWLVPPYEDLARFLVGVRLVGAQTATGGRAFDLRDLDRVERAFLSGYGTGCETAMAESPAFRVYQVLVLLDKWSALVATGGGDPLRRTLRRSWTRLSSRYFLCEAHRLLRLATS